MSQYVTVAVQRRIVEGVKARFFPPKIRVLDQTCFDTMLSERKNSIVFFKKRVQSIYTNFYKRNKKTKLLLTK